MRNQFDAKTFAQRVLITVGIVIPILLLVWLIGSVIFLLMLVFTAVLIHCFFNSFAQFLHKKTKLSKGWALLVSVIIVLAVLFVGNLFLAPHVVAQVEQLIAQIPQSFENAKSYLQQFWWGQYAVAQIPNDAATFFENNAGLMQKALGVFSTTFGLIGNLYIILLLVAYFLVNPYPYVSGLVALFPKPKRQRIQEVIKKVYITLQLWLKGKLISMLIVAVLTIGGLYILGIPLALTLGLLAGFLSFIPNFGPILALIPAILVAFTQGPSTVLYVILLYITVQILESNIAAPLIQRHMIELPFAMIVIAQVTLGVLTGILGLILATPIVAAIIVTVQMLYVRDVLADESAEVEY